MEIFISTAALIQENTGNDYFIQRTFCFSHPLSFILFSFAFLSTRFFVTLIWNINKPNIYFQDSVHHFLRPVTNRCYKTRPRCSINQIEFQIQTKYRMFVLIPSFTEQSKVTFCLYCCEVFSRLFSMNYWFTWRWVLAYLQSPDALYAAFFSFSSVEILRHLNVQKNNRKVII